MKNKKKSSLILLAVIVLSVLLISISFSYAALIEENDVRVKENSELTYYIDVIYDGKDSSVVSSSDIATSSVYSDYIEVTDKIPEGLTFLGFVNSEDGGIGAVKRSDNSSCPGYVIDGINGLKYDEVTRTVSFRVKNLQAGCKITVGIITKLPSLEDKTRMDFYNTAYGKENQFSAKSNTVHVFMGKEDTETYTVSYEYTGDVPSNAPELPSVSSYPADTIVGVSQDVSVDGYSFSGWTTQDVEVVDGLFTMPAKNIVFTGSFTEKEEQVEQVTYTISGDVPEGYKAPRDKSYSVGSDVKLDSLKPGDVINGYRFLGWTSEDVELPSVSDDESTIFTMPDHSVRFVGKFERISYKVTYQFQGSVIPPNAELLLPEEKSYYPEDKVTVEPYPEAAGYKFLGWYSSDTFDMPEEDVVIYGEWALQTGTFSPSITKEIVDKKEYYHQGDVVIFKITVNNTADFPIRDVIIQEKSDGMEFVVGDGYEVLNSKFVKIDSILAGESVFIEARYVVGNDVVKEVTNTVELTGAVADNNYNLDTTKDYTASVTFNISNISLKINKTDEDGNPLTGAEFSLSKGQSIYRAIGSQSVMDNVASEFVSSSNGINFNSAPSNTNGKGIYTRAGTENNEYPIYYYRGEIDNNHVKFAGFCWKIVRTTETGGVKLIYDGVPDSNGYCNNTGTASQIGTSAFNSSSNSPADVGYMYGTRYTNSSINPSDLGSIVYGNDVTWDGIQYTLVDTIESDDWNGDRRKLAQKYHYTCLSTDNTCSSVYYIHYFGNSSNIYYLTLSNGSDIESAKDEMFTNTTSSRIKTTIDTWYAGNMTEYTKYLEDTIWCNDRSFYSGSLKGKDVDAGTGYSYFGAYGNNVSTKNPSVSCPNVNDSFTVSSENGNGALDYPVALLTADELTLAGHGWNGYSRNAYLYTGQYYWSLSPYYFHNYYAYVFIMYSNGTLNGSNVSITFGVRPSVSLAPGIMISGGDGTSEDPYEVFMSSSDEVSSGTTFTLEPNTTYYLNETRAPSGYQLLGKSLIVKVDSNGNVTIEGYDVDNQDGVASVSISNKKINILPNTGGVGIIPFVILGLIFVSAGVIYFVRLFRKKGEEYEKNHK